MQRLESSVTVSRKAAHRAAQEWLMSEWPASLGARRPLVEGIHEAIINAAEGRHSPQAIHDALRSLTSNRKYLAAVAMPDAMRVGLDGQPAAPVTDEHRQNALERLADRKR